MPLSPRPWKIRSVCQDGCSEHRQLTHEKATLGNTSDSIKVDGRSRQALVSLRGIDFFLWQSMCDVSQGTWERHQKRNLATARSHPIELMAKLLVQSSTCMHVRLSHIKTLKAHSDLEIGTYLLSKRPFPLFYLKK